MENSDVQKVLQLLDDWGKRFLVEFEGVRREVANLKTEVADLKAEVADLKTEVADLKAEVADLKTEVADLKTEVADLRTVGSMDKRLDQLSREIRITHRQSGLWYSDLQFEVSVLRDRVDRLESIVEAKS